MEILRAIAAAFATRDLSQLNGILKRISYLIKHMSSLTPASCLLQR